MRWTPMLAFLVFLGLLALIVIIAKLAAVALDHENAQRQRLFNEWQVAAQSVGLQVQRFTDRESRARGTLQGVPVHGHLKFEHENKQLVFRSALWANSASMPRQLSVYPDSVLRSVARLIEGEDVPIGDAHFDDLVELPVVDAHVCAALNYKARAQLTKLIGWGVTVEDGAVVCRSSWSTEQNRSLGKLLQSIASLARLLSVPPEELPQRLAFNALEDPAPAVQLRSLRYLVAPDTHAPRELIRRTALPLLGHVDARLRLLAAQHAGAEGWAALRALATGDAVALDVRIDAALSLGGRSELRDLEGLRSILVGSSPPELLCAALGAIDAGAGPVLLEAVRSCARHEHDSVRAAAARALGSLAVSDTEPLLMALLSDGSADVQQQSAEALGLFGSIAAVEPLLPLAESLVRPRLRQTARGAIGRIQSRLGDVEAGRLTLSDDDPLAGALDVADTSAGFHTGELSLAEERAEGERGEQRSRASRGRAGA